VRTYLEENGGKPVLEQRESFRVDGVWWKFRHDFQIQAGDFRGAVTNAGA
jgi:hypothetical protein